MKADTPDFEQMAQLFVDEHGLERLDEWAPSNSKLLVEDIAEQLRKVWQAGVEAGRAEKQHRKNVIAEALESGHIFRVLRNGAKYPVAPKMWRFECKGCGLVGAYRAKAQEARDDAFCHHKTAAEVSFQSGYLWRRHSLDYDGRQKWIHSKSKTILGDYEWWPWSGADVAG